jgi:hypothetical protein
MLSNINPDRDDQTFNIDLVSPLVGLSPFRSIWGGEGSRERMEGMAR